ncbi:MAG: LytTR family transcriptional regulator [Clostridia bacterium]|nr:LytTR family transcriptional regulator [Clostridia bacterium]MBQ2518350.1 LytTR family transcriptional regulator [Clostridia bacterium]MBQ4342196.1 LytTR family transcriptional regulator [Clostridia bacterium]
MKIKLMIGDEHYEETARFLAEKGIEIDDSAEFVLIERDKYPSHIAVRNLRGERLHIRVDDVVLIESFGHTVEVSADDAVYRSPETLRQLVLTLDPAQFIRISNSVIVRRDKVQRIDPSFSMKFGLTMKNGRRVFVTRGYYNAFREFFGI